MHNSESTIANLIKKLGLIKHLILLEEFDQAKVYLNKLENAHELDIINELLSDIQLHAYIDCIEKIENFINKQQQVVSYVDSEFEAAKTEIRKLETEINFITNEIAEAEKLIHDFSLKHNKELGEILKKLLKYRKEKLKKTKDNSQEKQTKYFQAEQDYEQFNEHYEQVKTKKLIKLTEDEKKELKTLYRKASKLCHPDVVADGLKEHAEKVFKDLQKAYEQNDIGRLKEILKLLEKRSFFQMKSESINEKNLLLLEVVKYKDKLYNLQKHLQDLQASSTYQTITKIDDWEQYFTETKDILFEELKEFEINE